MIRCDSAEYACLYILPHLFNRFFRLQDRRTFKERSILDHIFIRKCQIMGTGFCRDIIPFILRCFDLLRNRRMRHVTDMCFASCGLCNLDDCIRSHDLCNYRTGFQVCLPVIAPGFLHSLFLIFDDRIVFTVETCSSIKLFNDIHGLQSLSIA